tara:strand:+ start:372 stop:782 length:411 start_codon:yes stop_codon:yes gene_type:complete
MLNELREQIEYYANAKNVEKLRFNLKSPTTPFEESALLRKKKERLFADTENIMRGEFPGLNKLLPKGLKGDHLYNAGYHCFSIHHSEEKGLVVHLTIMDLPQNKEDSRSEVYGKIRRRLNEIEKTYGFTIKADAMT